MDKLGSAAGAVIFGGVSTLFKHFATTKGYYLCRGVATLSTGSAFILGAGVYAVSRVLNRYNPFDQENQQIAYRLTDGAITVLTGIVANLIVVGIAGELAVAFSAAAVTGASIALAAFLAVEVAKFAASYFVVNSLKIISLKEDEYGSYVGTTHTGENHENVIDFVGVFPELARAYIGDCTSHAKKKERRDQLEIFWKGNPEKKGFEDRFKELDISKKNNDLFNGRFLEQESENLKEEKFLGETSNQMESVGASTLIMAQLFVDANGKKQLYFVSVGDSELYLLREDELHQLTPKGALKSKDNPPSKCGELNGNIRGEYRVQRLIEVQPGDKIIGLTDGFAEFMGKEQIKEVLLQIDTTPKNLGTKLVDRLSQKDAGGEKKVDGASRSLSDDVSVFMMIVPK